MLWFYVLLMQVEKGTYNGLSLVGPIAREGALLVTAPTSAPTAAADALPLEFRTVGEFEPRYRVPVDALGGGMFPFSHSKSVSSHGQSNATRRLLRSNRQMY